MKASMKVSKFQGKCINKYLLLLTFQISVRWNKYFQKEEQKVVWISVN